MPKFTKPIRVVFAVLIVSALAYTWLMLRYQSAVPSDIAYSIADNEWAIDSAFVCRIVSIVGPDDRLMLDHSDTLWSLYGAIYAHNNLRKFLSIEAIEIREDAARFSAEAEVWYLCPPTREDRRNSHYFMIEPFAVVYNLGWSKTHLGQEEFNSFIERAFRAHSLRMVVRTNHGNITIDPRGYRTMRLGELVREYPLQKQR
jgi:hypothetical protein